VRRARLNRAAVLLATTAQPVLAVAAAVGYPNADSFARACRAAFGATPAALRARAVVPPPLLPLKPGALPMHPVAIETYAPRTLACLPHRGAYTEIGETFARLAAEFGARGLWPRVTGAAVALYYDDPAATPVAELRAHAGMPVAGPMPEPFDAVETQGGRVAVLTLKGPYTGIPAAWAWLYGTWLPEAGEEPADAAPWEEYPNSPMDTAPESLVTRICVPLKG
jgi:AraC family transcriptional regulator